jgi:hypothetical protein
MAISQRVKDTEGLREATVELKPRVFPWRLEYPLLSAVAVLITAFTVALFYFGADIGKLKTYGYPGLFLLNFLGAASIFLATPAGVSVRGAGAFLNDLLGIPALFGRAAGGRLGRGLGQV